jgi:hypothetical protein
LFEARRKQAVTTRKTVSLYRPIVVSDGQVGEATFAGVVLAVAATLLIAAKTLDLLESAFGLNVVTFGLALIGAGALVTVLVSVGYDALDSNLLRSARISRAVASTGFALIAAAALVVIAVEHITRAVGADSWVGVGGAVLMLVGSAVNCGAVARRR